MKFLPIPEIAGAFTAVLDPHEDSRGILLELWNQTQANAHSEWAGFAPVQINFVSTASGAIRGIHRTRKEAPQRKVVTCVAGKVLDVLVDLRPESKTFRILLRLS